MEYQIRVSDDGSYIEIVSFIDVDRVSAFKHTVEAHILGRELGIDLFLVDYRLARNLDQPSVRFEFANQTLLNTEMINPRAVVAVVVDKDDSSHDFSETLMLNVGLNVRYFRDIEQAKQHLLSYQQREVGRSS